MQRMLPLTLSLGAALGLLAAGAANAAPMGGGMGGGMEPGAGTMPSGPSTYSSSASRLSSPSDTSASARLREGMTVKDSAGVTVGKITKVGQSGGAPAALVDVGGKTVVVMGSTLSVSGGNAKSTQTKEQIEASPSPNPS